MLKLPHWARAPDSFSAFWTENVIFVSTVGEAYHIKLWNSGYQGQFGCHLASAGTSGTASIGFDDFNYCDTCTLKIIVDLQFNFLSCRTRCELRLFYMDFSEILGECMPSLEGWRLPAFPPHHTRLCKTLLFQRAFLTLVKVFLNWSGYFVID